MACHSTTIRQAEQTLELIGALLLLVGLVLLLLALLAPLESLRWWAGWTQEHAPDTPLSSSTTAASPAPLYVVYLSGVAAIDPKQMHQKESSFLDLVADKIALAVLIRDVFPYSVTNNPLTETDHSPGCGDV